MVATSVIEERGPDWDVRQDYEIIDVERSFVGNVVRATDHRVSSLPVLLRSIKIKGAHTQEIIGCYALLREASLRTPYIGNIYRLVVHHRNEGDQLVVAWEPPQFSTLAVTLQRWLRGSQDAPPAFDDAHVLHTALGLIEGLRLLEEIGFGYRNVHPATIGIGNSPPWTFMVPQIMDYSVPGSDSMKNPPSYLPPFARNKDAGLLSSEEHCRRDLYALGATLFTLRTWNLWPDAEKSNGMNDRAILELNKFRVGDPLRDVLINCVGTAENPPAWKSFEEAQEHVEEAFWKVAAVKSGIELPTEPGQQNQPSQTMIGTESLVLLEDRDLWNHAPEATQDAAILEVERELGEEFKWLRTEAFECKGESSRIAIFEHIQTGMEFHLIPGGLFGRGTKDIAREVAWAQKQGWDLGHEFFVTESPAVTVIIQPILIAKYPCLAPQWEKLGNAKKIKNTDLVPVTNLSYDEIQKRLGDAPGTLRLPSEAEWEYACRAGANTRFFWGDEMDDNYCWHTGNCDGDPQDVTKHAKHHNSFGLVDMLGNVSEWCEDHYRPRYINAPKDHLPFYEKKPSDAPDRVIRGGSAWFNAAFCRSASRTSVRTPKKSRKKGDPLPPAFGSLGFRPVRTLGA